MRDVLYEACCVGCAMCGMCCVGDVLSEKHVILVYLAVICVQDMCLEHVVYGVCCVWTLLCGGCFR